MPAAELVTRCRPWLGTFVEVTADRIEAVEAGFDAIAVVHALMNRYNASSDVAAINAGRAPGRIAVHRWTAAVLARALFWSRLSEGAFDPMLAGDWREMALAGRSVALPGEMTIDLGGIAKGFAVDSAVQAMRAAGAVAGLVNAGGDMRGFGPRPWPVTLVEPLHRNPVVAVTLDNCALATSAVRPGGASDHLPGRCAGVLSVTVRCPAAIDADALTKIVLSGSPAAGRCLAVAGATALMIEAGGRVVEVGPLARAA